MIEKVGEQGYTAFMTLGSRGISYAANVIVSTAAKVRRPLQPLTHRIVSLC